MAKPKSQFLGVFPAGEIPVPAEQTFKDKDGNPIDLANFTPQVRIDGPDETADYVTGSVAKDSPTTTGRVIYTWSGDEFLDIGKYEMIIWVGDNVTPLRFGSYLIKWEVYDAPGSLPTV